MVGPPGWGQVDRIDRPFVRVLGEQPWSVVDALDPPIGRLLHRVAIRRLRAPGTRGARSGRAARRRARARPSRRSWRRGAAVPRGRRRRVHRRVAASCSKTKTCARGSRRAAGRERASSPGDTRPKRTPSRTRTRSRSRPARPHPQRMSATDRGARSIRGVRVLLDVSAVPERPVGAGRYTVALASGLAARPEVELHLLSRRDDQARWEAWRADGDRARFGAGPAPGPARRGSRPAAPSLAARLDVDVWHGPHYTMPLRAGVPSVVTIHDLTFFDHPEWHERSKVVFFRRMIRAAAHRATVLVCVSSYTAESSARTRRSSGRSRGRAPRCRSRPVRRDRRRRRRSLRARRARHRAALHRVREHDRTAQERADARARVRPSCRVAPRAAPRPRGIRRMGST